MACDFGKKKACVELPAGGPPRHNASVYHERLHLKRDFVDGTPKLVYRDDEHELVLEGTPYRRRWKIERLFAWLNKFKRALTRCDRCDERCTEFAAFPSRSS
ncbi:hypothetical protein [Paraburkholderia dinghuensis]|uniref:Transposase DDE domain-containing protein n=1 Tax=Paraburkholderia dinghuensis TaxID=2305225 RepID=A0A3N6Q404_9BURK|nr:hypothetical protein [Paraburkholderia dinghuensis]RQH07116.1 hypothetical protein D1Y85_10685 [Paraburkholderia dinghuensis]